MIASVLVIPFDGYNKKSDHIQGLANYRVPALAHWCVLCSEPTRLRRRIMADDHRRFEKVLALAIDPGAIEGEAIAAFRRARELVRQNPSLAHPLSSPVPATPDPPPQATFKVSITDVHPDWILILAGLLSKTAYELNLKQKIDFDFSRSLTAINILCDGSLSACTKFEREVEWAVNYINEQLRKPTL
jgi:hypothetical protein